MAGSPLLEIRNLSYAIGGRAILRDISLDVRRGRNGRAAGPQRIRQDHAAKTVNGLVAPTAGEIRFEGRRRRSGTRSGCAAAWDTSSRTPASSRTGRWRRTSGWCRAWRTGPRSASRSASTNCSPRWAWRPPNSAPAIRASFPAGRSSAWESPARWPPIRRCCCSTNLSPRSTRSRASTCSGCFWNCGARVRKTALFVTHDVREALMMASRIALLKDGALDTAAPPARVPRRRHAGSARLPRRPGANRRAQR